MDDCINTAGESRTGESPWEPRKGTRFPELTMGLTSLGERETGEFFNPSGNTLGRQSLEDCFSVKKPPFKTSNGHETSEGLLLVERTNVSQSTRVTTINTRASHRCMFQPQ